MYPQVLFQHRKPDRINTFAEYREQGGYSALSDVIAGADPAAVIATIDDAQLLGRGGAGFPAGRKLMTVAQDAPHPRYLICNADEMEPGTFKDRVLLHADPHLLIEGMAIVAYTVRARHGIIFIRPEYENAARILEREIRLAREAGFLGEKIHDSDFSFEIVVHRSGGRYICGEVTALISALEGCRPNPRKAPPYPTDKGLWQQPTVLNNVETLAYVPLIVRHGAQWFRDLALTESAAGTKLFSISGHVNKPGCYEVPLGVPLSEMIENCCGGMRDGRPFKGCLPGGASTGFLSAEHYHIPMDYESLKAVGNRLGTGAVMVFDDTTCMVAATLNLTNFFARESCGWCTPCREGFPYLKDLLYRLENGMADGDWIGQVETLCGHLYKAYCAFAPGGVAPIESLLANFGEEVQAHIDLGGCPMQRQ
ncbi:MAG: NADH-ubiquinone oxidoreductase-F iron-sulfur binding region domain-containing protein [Desulfosarcinaceae bacterium]|nr:NADH-ubiquinone oxidoreductase-F iron-sulfur binding region domain-containing protein [Desulfosarcinaceae bacterium]